MKTRIWFSLFVLLGSISCFAKTGWEDDKIEQGLKLMATGDFSSALIKFRDAQIEHPASMELHFNIGMALYKLDRYEDARGAFESATFSRNQEIEKKALFHTGNCFVKEGKWEKALDYFNRAIQLDPGYQAAKINREFVVRTMKNQARKKKKQDKKKEEQKQIIEKLQKLIAVGVAVHDKSRDMMRVEGLKVSPSSLRDYADLLNAPLDDVLNAELKAAGRDTVVKSIAKKQEEVGKTLVELLGEVRAKIEAGKKGQDGKVIEGQPADPAIARLEKALPFLQNAEPNLENATKSVRDDSDLMAAQGFQSVALQDLIAARNELLDELARLIEAEMRVLVDTLRTQRASQSPTNQSEEVQATAKAEANRQGEEQKTIRQRTEHFGKGVEKHLDDLKSKLDEKTQVGGPGVEAGQDPMEEIRKFEKALTHLNEAARLMEESEPFLAQPDLDNAIPKEKAAARELVLARAALSPPQQQQQQKQDSESEKKDGEEKQEPSESEKSDKEDAEKKEEKKAESKKSEDLTDEQAKKTLEQQKQREMERRRDKKEKEKKARKNKSKGVKKDW